MAPIDTKTMRVLTAEEKAAYARDGFVVIPDVIGPEERARIHAELDRLGEEGPDEGAAETLMQLGLRSPLTRDLCADERFLTLVEDLVYPGIAIYSAKLVGKPAHCQSICHWHQDDAYYQENSQSETRMSLWLCLDDSDETNGGVHFVPGSHKHGLQPSQWFDHGHCRKGMQVEDLDLSTAVVPRVPAGAVVLFHALTWHHSGPIPTDRRRRAFIVSYQDALAAAGNGPQWKILRPA